jgi:hypothetical protein
MYDGAVVTPFSVDITDLLCYKWWPSAAKVLVFSREVIVLSRYRVQASADRQITGACAVMGGNTEQETE